MPCECGLKTWLCFQCFIIKGSHKSHEMKIIFFYSETMHSFYGSHKALAKTWNKIFHCFHFEISTFKASVKQMTKAALALGLRKHFLVHAIFRMYTHLHTQANHKMWHNFYPCMCTEFIDEQGTKFFLPKWYVRGM